MNMHPKLISHHNIQTAPNINEAPKIIPEGTIWSVYQIIIKRGISSHFELTLVPCPHWGHLETARQFYDTQMPKSCSPKVILLKNYEHYMKDLHNCNKQKWLIIMDKLNKFYISKLQPRTVNEEKDCSITYLEDLEAHRKSSDAWIARVPMTGETHKWNFPWKKKIELVVSWLLLISWCTFKRSKEVTG